MSLLLKSIAGGESRAGPDSYQHSFGHIDCPACNQDRALSLARITPSLTFAEASSLWIASRCVDPSLKPIRARFIREKTEKSYRQYIDSLNLFFGRLTLESIHIGHVRNYQEARISGSVPFIRKRRPNKNVIAAPCPAGPKKVNQELSIFKAILSRAGCWTQELGEFYEPFMEEVNDVPRALSPEEQRKWLDVARSRQRWWLVYWYSILAFETTMGTNEMRSLRIGDVNISHGIVNVPAAGAKNRYRARTIPLISAEVKWAAEQLLERSRDLGANAPTDYLFPYRRPPAPFDPRRPMTVSGIKKLWEEVRIASGMPHFRPYDTRHTAITRWAEAGMPIAEIMAMAGHLSIRMMRHYMQISEGAKRRALEEAIRKVGPKSERAEPFASSPFYIRARHI